ncbi:DUF58 domain-containing protein [Paenibacillus senegalensis]|uniref:DUF58 domain-containing protein n=1 Tax=Paenibacillus senegalensis TaxID=1465766 RepID=UPI000474C601|nr:DUF58 domain-containing protein [Paenibacillus senegalensis]
MTTSSRKRWRPFRFLVEVLERRAVVPTLKMVWLTGASALITGLGYFLGLGLPALLLTNGLLLGAAVLDISLLPRRKGLSFSRELPKQADIGSPFEVTIHAKAQDPVSIPIEVRDDLPAEFVSPPVEQLAATWQGRHAEIRYTTTGRERGQFTLGWFRVRLRGPLGLWQKQMKVEQPQVMNIYPDLSGVRGVLSSMQNHLMLEGKRLFRRDRSGSELHAIREYVPDDDPRMINWRATARAGTLMTNVFRPERGKTVMILIDCGRRMGVELAGRTKLDAVLEAALSLAAVALKQGDKAGLIVFASEVKIYVPPGAGLTHLQAMTDAVFNVQSDYVESSYEMALQFLMRVQRKRTLTILFSDLDLYMLEKSTGMLLARVRRQHHLLLVGLRDEVLHAWTQTESESIRDAYIKSMAHKLTMQRMEQTARIKAAGIEAIDVPVGELAWTTVNRYLQIKSSDVL